MIEAGLQAEVQSLVDHQEISALRTVGYQEIFDFINGKNKWAESVNLIKQNFATLRQKAVDLVPKAWSLDYG